MFLPVSWQSSMRFATKLLCRHQDEVRQIYFDPIVDGNVRAIPAGLYKRYWQPGPGGCADHEAFWPGDKISVNAAVPSSITVDDFWRMMDFAGRFRGISPYKQGEWGFFEVVSVQPRSGNLAEPPIRLKATEQAIGDLQTEDNRSQILNSKGHRI
jgi:hypothetical protein